jgi:SAM-dependent methyltransferase
MWRYFVPWRLKFVRRSFRARRFTLLDVGCGINSFAVTRYWLPNVAYYGLDWRREEDPSYYAAMDGFYLVNLEGDSLDAIPEKFFDVVMLSHVIEHLDNGLEVIRGLTAKLAPGGYIYIETPSLRTLRLPSAIGFLHFHDDSTHKRLYSIYEIANALLVDGIKIVRGGRRRDPVGIFVLGPPALAHNLYYLLRRGRLYGRNLWDLLGVADFVLGRKP